MVNAKQTTDCLGRAERQLPETDQKLFFWEQKQTEREYPGDTPGPPLFWDQKPTSGRAKIAQKRLKTDFFEIFTRNTLAGVIRVFQNHLITPTTHGWPVGGPRGGVGTSSQ